MKDIHGFDFQNSKRLKEMEERAYRRGIFKLQVLLSPAISLKSDGILYKVEKCIIEQLREISP